jgi:hypothetical protein
MELSTEQSKLWSGTLSSPSLAMAMMTTAQKLAGETETGSDLEPISADSCRVLMAVLPLLPRIYTRPHRQLSQLDH